MKKIILLAVITLLLGWTVYDFVADSDQRNEEQLFSSANQTDLEQEEEVSEREESDVGLEIGDQAPDFQLDTLSGETIQLSDYRGQRVMLNFWATWCPPCRAEMPDMERFYQEQDVEILAVNLTLTETTPIDVVEFIDDFGLTFTIPMDEQQEVSNLYEIRPVPTTFMIDSNGIIQQKALGALNYEQMVEALNNMQ